MLHNGRKDNGYKPSGSWRERFLYGIRSLVPKLCSISDVSESSQTTFQADSVISRSDSLPQSAVKTPESTPSLPASMGGDAIELSDMPHGTIQPSSNPCVELQPHDLNELSCPVASQIESSSSPNGQLAAISAAGTLLRARKRGRWRRHFQFKVLMGGGLSNLMALLSLIGMLFFGLRTYVLTLWGAQTQGLGTCAAFAQVSRPPIHAL